jgi:nitroreductase
MEEGLYLYVAGQNLLELAWEGDLRSKLGYEGLYNPNRKAIRVASHTMVIAMNTPLAMEISPLTEDNLKFVYLEAGHAAQNFILQAVDLGLGTTTITSFDLKRVYRLLRLPLEHRPIYIMPVGSPRESAPSKNTGG